MRRTTPQLDERTALSALQPWGVAFIVGSALAIIALTFTTWVDFNVAHLRGTDADAMTSAGDGYFVIALAALAVICAGALYLRPGLWSRLLPCIGISAIGIVAITSYQLATPWHAAGFDIHGAFVVSGHVTAAVYEVLALAGAMGLVAAVLASLHYRDERTPHVESARPVVADVRGH